MLNYTVILKDVPKNILQGLPEVLNQARLPNMQIDASINHDMNYACLDVETTETIKIFALSQVVDMIDYAGIGDFVSEIGVD